MNPYLQSLRTKYDKLRADMDEVLTRCAEAVNADGSKGRDATPGELQFVEDQDVQARALLAQIEQATEQEARHNRVTELAGKLADGNGGFRSVGADGEPDPYGDDAAAAMVPALMPSRKQVAELFRAVRSENPQPVKVTTAPRQPGQHHRATVTLAGDLGQPMATMDSRPLVEPRRIAEAAGLIAANVAGTTGVVFPVFLAGAAAQTGEGVAKGEYDAISPGEALPKVIAVWTDTTRQAMTSHPAFEAHLRSKLARLVAAQEDVLLQTKVMATTGIQTQAFVAGNQAGQVLIAATKVMDAVGAPADVALVNPADIGLLFGAGLANTPPAELAELDLQLWGMRVYPTSAQTAGLVLAGAWRAASRLVVGERPVYQVDPYTQMKTNKITTLLEEAVDLAVEEPAGFISVDIVTP